MTRYNPPPTWPPPPSGWEPGPSWTPDPAWPPPPPGWQLFIDADPPAPPAVEAFSSEPPETAAPQALTAIAPEHLSTEHLGARTLAKWDETRYKIGTITGISADATSVTVQLSGSAGIVFPRDQAHGGPPAPILYLST